VGNGNGKKSAPSFGENTFLDEFYIIKVLFCNAVYNFSNNFFFHKSKRNVL